MARPIGESTFKAPVARPWAAESEGGDEFERSLLGFCVGSILDQRVAGGENRTYWAGRLGLSKSHISKMTESPTPAFIERFVLELKNSTPKTRIAWFRCLATSTPTYGLQSGTRSVVMFSSGSPVSIHMPATNSPPRSS